MSEFKTHNIVIIQRRLTHYRVALFQRIKDVLSSFEINLSLLVGQETEEESKKGDRGELHWATKVSTSYYFSGKVCLQLLGKSVKSADLVIITQENRLLSNYWLMFNPFRKYKLAFWGHGANLQSTKPNGLRERFKRWTTTKVDWWFAYTEMSAGLVQKAGFPNSKITVLNNAIDAKELLQNFNSVSKSDLESLRLELGIGEGPVGVFIGSLYEDKQIDLLLDASESIRITIPDFHLLIIGDGPMGIRVDDWCSKRDWGHWVGARFGSEKAIYLKLGTIMLNPGAVGLGILDSFNSGVPMVTTDCGKHGPEIAYLKSGINGVMTANDLDSYTNACIELLRDKSTMDKLKEGCLKSGKKYTVENMAERFVEGIMMCLDEGKGTDGKAA